MPESTTSSKTITRTLTRGATRPTVALTTLGCKLNQAETEQIARGFASAGFAVVDSSFPADVYVVNTCTVTHVADRKSRQIIRQSRRLNPSALVVVTGCYANVSAEEIRAIDSQDPAVSGSLLVVPNEHKHDVVEIVARKMGRRYRREHDACPYPLDQASQRAHRTRAFVKIHDGCNQFCTYCIVPFARGPARSAPARVIIESINDLHTAGFKEVVLTGVHIGAYGHDLQGDDRRSLGDLVKAALDHTSIPRIRLSSIEPQDFDEAVLDLWTSSRLCRHLHLPLQSGCDSVLRRMGRPYTAEQFQRTVDKIRARIPEVAITTDIIVGFPGETDEEFKRTYDFAEEVAFAGIHVFKYSARKGTLAAELPNQVPYEVKKERSDGLIRLAQDSALKFASSFVGKTVDVLYESQIENGSRGPEWEGLTDNYLRVVSPFSTDLTNEIVSTRLIKLSEADLIGEIQ